MRQIYYRDGWRVTTNKDVQELFRQKNIVTKIKQGRIRWTGHVQRMEKTRIIKKIFTGKLDGRRKRD